MTKTVGLIGYPLGHSISPVFQQAAFDHLGMDIRYELWETMPEDIGDVVSGLRSSKKLGANVTVPYKEAVIPLLEELDSLASDIGAVNTIVRRGDKLAGYNTDAGGFLRSLKEQAGFDPAGKSVTVIGAGGVSRAVCFVLVRSGIGSLMLFDIDTERARRLASDLGPAVTVLKPGSGQDYETAVRCADLLVNCTPVGMAHSSSEGRSPVDTGLISPASLVYDVIYNPLKTRLLLDAESAGAKTLGGLSMLVYQGAAAFELWTGVKAPVDIMMKQAEIALH